MILLEIIEECPSLKKYDPVFLLSMQKIYDTAFSKSIKENKFLPEWQKLMRVYAKKKDLSIPE